MNSLTIKVLKRSYISLSFALALLVWGILAIGYFKIIFGLFIFIVTISSTIQSIKYEEFINEWIEENDNKLILYYTAPKKVQENIREHFLPLIPYPFLSVYYDGPSLGGDLDKKITQHIKYINTDLRGDIPLILKFKDGKLIHKELADLRKDNLTESDYDKILETISEVYNS